jgi:hypothetical protein
MSKLKSKVVSVLNSALHLEDVVRSGGMAPEILNLSSRQR